jgi:hypothetical protein
MLAHRFGALGRPVPQLSAAILSPARVAKPDVGLLIVRRQIEGDFRLFELLTRMAGLRPETDHFVRQSFVDQV